MEALLKEKSMLIQSFLHTTSIQLCYSWESIYFIFLFWKYQVHYLSVLNSGYSPAYEMQKFI